MSMPLAVVSVEKGMGVNSRVRPWLSCNTKYPESMGVSCFRPLHPIFGEFLPTVLFLMVTQVFDYVQAVAAHVQEGRVVSIAGTVTIVKVDAHLVPRTGRAH